MFYATHKKKPPLLVIYIDKQIYSALLIREKLGAMRAGGRHSKQAKNAKHTGAGLNKLNICCFNLRELEWGKEFQDRVE